jgi:hypothetical protein
VTEQAQDIVAILTESGVRTRRERAAFVAKLRDEMNLTWPQIGKQVNVSPQRAQQLYSLHRLFQRSANSPFADLSTRARHFLDVIAHSHSMPDDWEQQPAMLRYMAKIITEMTRSEAFCYRNLGHCTFDEIDKFLRDHIGRGFSSGLIGESHTEEDPKDYTAPASSQEAAQRLAEFMNQKGMIGEFKVWPKGTYRGSYAENDEFTITLSGFLAEAWDEQWRIVDEFDLLVRGLGYGYEMGTPSTLHFYRDEPYD